MKLPAASGRRLYPAEPLDQRGSDGPGADGTCRDGRLAPIGRVVNDVRHESHRSPPQRRGVARRSRSTIVSPDRVRSSLRHLGTVRTSVRVRIGQTPDMANNSDASAVIAKRTTQRNERPPHRRPLLHTFVRDRPRRNATWLTSYPTIGYECPPSQAMTIRPPRCHPPRKDWLSGRTG